MKQETVIRPRNGEIMIMTADGIAVMMIALRHHDRLLMANGLNDVTAAANGAHDYQVGRNSTLWLLMTRKKNPKQETRT